MGYNEKQHTLSQIIKIPRWNPNVGQLQLQIVAVHQSVLMEQRCILDPFVMN